MVAFGPDGAGYLVYQQAFAGRTVQVFLHRSDDGGKTWGPRVGISEKAQGDIDHAMIAVDHTGGKLAGRIYVGMYASKAGILVRHSRDGVAPFKPRPLSRTGTTRTPRSTWEAYSHEESSAGFWPGGGAVPYPAFYSYAYPDPAGFDAAPVRPAAAFYSRDLREFILPYQAVRTAPDPDDLLLGFLEDTYRGAAELSGWDRAALERPVATPGK